MLFHGALLIDLVVTFHIIKRNVPDRISNDKSEKREREREFDFNKKKKNYTRTKRDSYNRYNNLQ